MRSTSSFSHARSRGRCWRRATLASLTSLFLASLASAQASLASDKPDYAPGETAVLTGAGFEPYETVTMQVLHADGTPSTGEDHEPWDVQADDVGGFVTTWHVCEDDCIGALLVANADGQSSLLHAECYFTDDLPCGTGVVTVSSVGGSCVTLTPGGGANGPDSWNVVEGETYWMRIENVTEWDLGSNPNIGFITVFVQGSSTGNFCFDLDRVGTYDFEGSFTMPDPACFTYPIGYVCGRTGPCVPTGGVVRARGPTNQECRQVHLRASTFDPSCNWLGEDRDCHSCDPCILTCPADALVECGMPTDPTATGTPTGCANAVHSDAVTPGACAGSYTIERTWTAPDGCGGTSTCVQTITVIDTTPPAISCPADADVDCSAPTDPGSTGEATASDGCSGATVGYVDSIATGNCAGNYVITRTWTATDDCGNSASCAQTIRVTDSTPPDISCPADADVDCTASTDPSSLGSATATDDCSGVADISYADAVDQPDPACASLTIRRTWTATDGCGNSSTCEQTITVTDSTPPDIACPADVVQAAGGACCVTVDLGIATGSDDCSGVTITNDAPAEFCVGDTLVTWTATDGCGNSSSCTQTVSILGQLCASKYYDANANGIQDGGEPAIPGWRFDVTGASGTTTLYADSSGSVCIDVPAGSYTVTEVAPAANWVGTSGSSCNVTVDATDCAPSCSFGNYCFAPPSNGKTLGFWSNKNGEAILRANDPAWRTLLNGLNLRNANGSNFDVSPTASFSVAYGNFRLWILSANATNMAYMLSAQLAATTLNVSFNGLGDAQGIIVPGGVKTGAGVCIVPFLSVSQPISCGSPPLLSLTALPGSTACGCSSNDGLVTIGDLRMRADCLLGAYPSAVMASTQRTYEECVKNLLDMINNNGNNGYACGGLSQYINPGPQSCPFSPNY